MKVGDSVEIQDRAGAEQYTAEGQQCTVIETTTAPMSDRPILLRLQDPCGDEFYIPANQVKLIKNGGMK
ncbi:hypothetical protein UE46_p05205 [Listeria phage LWP01]|uniref:Uncharacterized protein n=1 Tax=Listeria weihenstephanensis TaxID=1006155 RepID=A0A3B6XGH7_9LIST|nr:hypothetical protein UE46_05205 [Listeria phage LWP01] [Listeria weihenstephanensis]AQY52626.1 hypothetical protein UE46_p05205 [Listeria phage LWP01]